MKKLVLVIMSVVVVGIWCVDSESGHQLHHRVKRKVLFTKNSKLFFRLNGKDNVIPWTQIFAHGWAFRVNYELPETLPKRHRFFKREARGDFEDFSVIQGYSCILKYLCEFVNKIKLSSKCGIFCEIGNIAARSQGLDAEFFQMIFEKCDDYIGDCPYSFKDNFYYTNGMQNIM